MCLIRIDQMEFKLHQVANLRGKKSATNVFFMCIMFKNIAIGMLIKIHNFLHNSLGFRS
jgi:hypothetical protein